jgi:tetratricopeptide (TPR) repeat protein
MITIGYNKPGIILYLFYFLISSILLCNGLNADTIKNSDSQQHLIIEKIRQAMDAYYRMDDQRAENIFNETISKWPHAPLPYLFKGGFYLNILRYRNQNREEENQKLKDKIISLNDRVIDIARNRISEDPDDVDALYCLGGAYGNTGRAYILNGQWWKGFWKGKKGFKILKKVVKKDPDYYDAYLGLGIYHYFTAILPKIAKFISFLLGGPMGDKEKGIREFELVRDNSILLAIEARKILLRVSRWEEDWDGFYNGSKWLAEHYPENPHFQIPYLYGLTQNSSYEDAQHQRGKVDSLIQNDPSQLPLSVRVKYYRYSGLLSYNLSEYSRSVESYLSAIELSRTKWPPERIWTEDYYYLAASNAKLKKEKEAFKYLRKAIEKGWQKDNLKVLPEWQPYRHNQEFIQIISK